MLLEEELTREALAKTRCDWNVNYQNIDKKDKCPTSKEVHALDC